MEKQKSTGLTKSAPKVQITTLTRDLGLAIQVDSLNTLLNTQPPKNWYKNHKGNDYLPIDRVKNNLITIFQDYDWEIQSVQVIANSICVTGNLYIINPVTGRQRKLAGIGAWPIQLNKGSAPTDFNNIISDAIQKNAPAAESLALKNAASKLGKLFGGGNEEVEFMPAYSKEVPLDEIKQSLASTE
jgi:hypothetical protein